MAAGANRPALAAALVVGAMALFGLIDNFMRLAAETGGLWQFHLLRAAIALGLLMPFAWAWGVRLRPSRPGRVLLRCVLNSLAMVLYFGGLGFLPIAQVVAGLFAAPLFSVLLFGDRVGPWPIAAVGIGFLGILLALGLDAGNPSGWSLLPLLSGAIYGLQPRDAEMVRRGGDADAAGRVLRDDAAVRGAGVPSPRALAAAGGAGRGGLGHARLGAARGLVPPLGPRAGGGIAPGRGDGDPRLSDRGLGRGGGVRERAPRLCHTLGHRAVAGGAGAGGVGGLALVTAAGVMIARREPRAVPLREEA